MEITPYMIYGIIALGLILACFWIIIVLQERMIKERDREIDGLKKINSEYLKEQIQKQLVDSCHNSIRQNNWFEEIGRYRHVSGTEIKIVKFNND